MVLRLKKDYLRGILYKLGLRPHPRSIFYSGTWDWKTCGSKFIEVSEKDSFAQPHVQTTIKKREV